MSKFSPGDEVRFTQTLKGTNVGVNARIVKLWGDHPLFGTLWEVVTEDDYPCTTESGRHLYTKEAVHPENWMEKI
jgi:hypothetical protein